MIRFTALLTATAALVTLAGCKDETVSTRTVQYYLEHAAERQEDLTRCQNDAALAMTPNCMNAKNADAEAGLKKRADFGGVKGLDGSGK